MLNNYRLIEKLGQGGMGTVYKAEQLSLKRLVAIKSYTNAELSPHGRTALASEAKVLSAIDHPNIAKVVDYHEDEKGNAHLVLEFIQGRTLQEIVEAGGQLPYEEARPLLVALFRTLEFLHKHKPPVLVRDIKPDNVMVTKSGQLKLIDFGLARFHDSTDNATKTVLKGYGSAGYAPPEQHSSRPTDRRSDIYSACATAFFILTGQIPPSATDRMMQISDLPDLAKLNRTVPPAVQAVLRKGASIKPDERGEITEILKRMEMADSTSRPTPARASGPPPTSPAVAVPRPTARRLSPGQIEERDRKIGAAGCFVATVCGCVLFCVGIMSPPSVRSTGQDPPQTPYVPTNTTQKLPALPASSGPEVNQPRSKPLELSGLKLWQFKHSVKAALGTPSSTKDLEGEHYDIYESKDQVLIVGYNADWPENLASIGVFGNSNGPWSADWRGISLGSSRKDVLDAFGPPDRIKEEHSGEWLVYSGMSVAVNEGLVTAAKLSANDKLLSDSGTNDDPLPDLSSALRSGNFEQIMSQFRPDAEIYANGEVLSIDSSYQDFLDRKPASFRHALDLVAKEIQRKTPQSSLRVNQKVGTGLVYKFTPDSQLEEIHFLPYNGAWRVYEIKLR